MLSAFLSFSSLFFFFFFRESLILRSAGGHSVMSGLKICRCDMKQRRKTSSPATGERERESSQTLKEHLGLSLDLRTCFTFSHDEVVLYRNICDRFGALFSVLI